MNENTTQALIEALLKKSGWTVSEDGECRPAGSSGVQGSEA